MFVQKIKKSELVLRVVQNPGSCQTEKLMAGTKFSDYLGLKQYKKAKDKTFQPFKVGQSASKF